jgi:hypothetical protein
MLVAPTVSDFKAEEGDDVLDVAVETDPVESDDGNEDGAANNDDDDLSTDKDDEAENANVVTTCSGRVVKTPSRLEDELAAVHCITFADRRAVIGCLDVKCKNIDCGVAAGIRDGR